MNKDIETFEFSKENLAKAEEIVAKYPAGKQHSAIMPLLDLAQREIGWLPQAAIRYVADYLDMPYIRAWEVATFYTMYHLEPVGKHVIGICTTTPCWLCNSDAIVDTCRKELGIEFGETTDDGMFTLEEVECLGACVNAPMIQIGDFYYEDLDADSMKKIIDTLKKGEEPEPGSQTGRQTSCPKDGPTTLKDMAETG